MMLNALIHYLVYNNCWGDGYKALVMEQGDGPLTLQEETAQLL